MSDKPQKPQCKFCKNESTMRWELDTCTDDVVYTCYSCGMAFIFGMENYMNEPFLAEFVD